MSIAGDLRVLRALLLGRRSGGSHAQRLESFYAPQAAEYDRFRARLLQGREELVRRLPAAPGTRLVELGAGTGANLEFFGTALEALGMAELVDLCPSLVAQARRRHAHRPNVRVIEADATRWRPAEPPDAVYFSYSLSMIPDWRAALDNALDMLRPGGTLAVVDFYVSPPQAGAGRVQHGVLARTLWPRWFAHDGVRVAPDVLERLTAIAPPTWLAERKARIPYLPLLRVPYFVYVGIKRG